MKSIKLRESRSHIYNHAHNTMEIHNMDGVLISNEHKEIHLGYGACRACKCKGYVSKHNGSHECTNCDHHYDMHYSV